MVVHLQVILQKKPTIGGSFAGGFAKQASNELLLQGISQKTPVVRGPSTDMALHEFHLRSCLQMEHYFAKKGQY